jgi:hypothetical protein
VYVLRFHAGIENGAEIQIQATALRMLSLAAFDKS